MKAVLIAITFSLSPLAAMPALAADSIYTSWQNNLAVGGYDTVSFFSGKPQLSRNWVKKYIVQILSQFQCANKASLG